MVNVLKRKKGATYTQDLCPGRVRVLERTKNETLEVLRLVQGRANLEKAHHRAEVLVRSRYGTTP